MKYCVIIPVYNAENHITTIIRDVMQYTNDIIVVNDGSNDGTIGKINLFNSIKLISYNKNRGKGYALKKAFKLAIDEGFEYAITIDADGQHKAKDIQVLIKKAKENTGALIVGSRRFDNPNIPKGNIFANRFSNFWFKIQTGITLPDTQTGFRAYPLEKIKRVCLITSRYEAELELLVRSAWRNIKIIPQPIEVYYPPSDKRISHFRKGKDFFRISLLNFILCITALLLGYPSMLIRKILSS